MEALGLGRSPSQGQRSLAGFVEQVWAHALAPSLVMGEVALYLPVDEIEGCPWRCTLGRQTIH